MMINTQMINEGDKEKSKEIQAASAEMKRLYEAVTTAVRGSESDLKRSLTPMRLGIINDGGWLYETTLRLGSDLHSSYLRLVSLVSHLNSGDRLQFNEDGKPIDCLLYCESIELPFQSDQAFV